MRGGSLVMADCGSNTYRLVALWLLACAGGCSFIDRHASAESKSPLGQATPSPDSVTLEIFFARGALGDPTINGRLWNEIDEQRLPSDLRRKLAENGFRAGIIGGHVPDDLAKLLTLTDKPLAKGKEPASVSLEEEPNVTLRLLQARAGNRNEVICSGVYDSLPVLERKEDQIGGRQFLQAEGRLALKSLPDTPNRVQLELVPELHHDEQQARLVGSDGFLRLEAGKPRKVFDELRMRVTLTPGEMLVMTSLPSRPGSLGHYFFTQPTSERLSQKLLVIRVAQGGSDVLFSNEPTEVADVQLGGR
jgi:hypothetical protein